MTTEQWQIARFLDITLGRSAGSIQFGDEPDALIHREGRTVGVEHTRLLRPSENGFDMRAHEKVKENIVLEAQRLAEQRGVKPLHVFVSFNDRIKLFKKETPLIAELLADVVLRIEPDEGGESSAEKWQFEMRGLSFPTGVERVAAYHRAEWGESMWQSPHSSCLPRLQLSDVTDRVNRKELRLPAYRQRCDDVWLLLVVEGFAPSGAWDLEYYDTKVPIKTSFDRIYLFDQFRAVANQITTLRTT